MQRAVGGAPAGPGGGVPAVEPAAGGGAGGVGAGRFTEDREGREAGGSIVRRMALLTNAAVGLIGILAAIATERVSWLAVGLAGATCFIVVARDER